jgi:serine/threonine protein kinase/dienelactone hydrolase
MHTSASSRDEQLFSAALARPAHERAAFLEGACLGDEALHARVRGLLAAHEGSDSVLIPPLASPVGNLEEKPGTRIGRYKLLQKIGEGGCGVVWMAEQEEPVRRRVALKVIKLGMDTKAVVARFEAERQALALMDHPNIAKVHDAGATDTGRPFFVMELVRGIPITKYCDENQLAPPARLELFIKVCQAVQHAHQKGIVHRDLKPSNILVTVNDGQPTPKVIDFGIAKATQGRLTDATIFTAFEQFIGTPAYMSPEQAELSSLDVDTRSDIYSLGVLLYELLTGRPPFDAKQLAQAGVDQIRQHIREIEPPRPSARLQTLGADERTTIARLRSTAASELSLILRGDLDWIVMRCLEKDRTRRYDTANGLAMDVQRYLGNEPVVARPPSTVYLLQKLVSRHKVGFIASAAVLAAVVIGSVLTTAQALRALRAERMQNELRESVHQAEAQAITARRTAEERDQRLEKIRWARETALPEINRLRASLDMIGAFKLATEVEKYLPEDPDITGLWPRISFRASIETTPPGARFYLKPYRNPSAEWEFLGVTPIKNVLLGRDIYRWRIEKPGYATIERAGGITPTSPLTRTNATTEYRIILDRVEDIPPGMVRVEAGPGGLPRSLQSDRVQVERFLIDRHEVTNREFKEFVDRGGYTNPRFWRQRFFKDGKELSPDDAIAIFHDATGKPGPATWRDGKFPVGQDDFPVTGVSWYEAAAYAESVGKRLPSIYHWMRAATGAAQFIAELSNFAGRGPAAVGTYQGITTCGACDMAGNAREWCWNEAEPSDTGNRYILGGSSDESAYMFFNETDAVSPFDRSAANGFRCVLLSPETSIDPRWDAPAVSYRREPADQKPASDETFQIYRSLFTYDHTELDAKIVDTEEVEKSWRRQRVSFRTGYGGERMDALIFLPKNTPPPYQIVLFFPGSGALTSRTNDVVRPEFCDSIVKSGRVFVYPIYKATHERGDGRTLPDYQRAKNDFRDLFVQWSKDLGRTIDYLETRTDLQSDKMAYLGFSLGAAAGFIFPAIEDRFKASILVSGGIWVVEVLPEINQFHYAPRITVPTLMLNGRFDFVFLEPGQRQLFRLLGTPAEHKRHVLVDSGHIMRIDPVEPELLGWLDRYLGPVK